jgi:hypothetical protein
VIIDFLPSVFIVLTVAAFAPSGADKMNASAVASSGIVAAGFFRVIAIILP